MVETDKRQFLESGGYPCDRPVFFKCRAVSGGRQERSASPAVAGGTEMPDRENHLSHDDHEPENSHKGSGGGLSTEWIDGGLDEENRVTIPEELRKLLAMKKVKELCVGFSRRERLLILCPCPNWNFWLAKLRGEVGEERWREIAENDTARLQVVRPDSRGRVKLNRWALGYIGIKEKEKVVFRGREKWIELCSEEDFKRRVFGKD